MLPGTSTTIIQTAPPALSPTDTSTWFVAGITQQGPLAPVVVGSLAAYVATFGPRVSNGLLYDSLDLFFKDGVGAGGTPQAVVSRVVGPTPVYATVNLLDSGAGISLVVTAKSYGTYANGWKIIVVGATAPYTIQVQDSASNVLETSPALTNQADAVAWGSTAAYVNVTLGATGLIPAAETNKVLASGTDDYASATDTTWLNAINLLTKDLGPGQVSMPGRSTAAAHSNLTAHAAANNRRALLDYADTGSRSTLVTAALVDEAVANSEYAAGFAPWITIPGVTGTTTRTVPHSALIAALIARNDKAGVTPNQPSAGERFGQSTYALGVSQPAWSDADRELLNNAGVNVARVLQGTVTEYGYRTLAPPSIAGDWLLLSNSRLVMAIEALGQEILDGYVFSQVDGRGFLISDVIGDLNGMLTPFYNAGSLFGLTPADAYTVTVVMGGALQLIATLKLQLSEYAEQISLQIATTTMTQGVS